MENDEFSSFIMQTKQKKKEEEEINKLNSSLLLKMNELSDLYPDRIKPVSIRAVLDKAKGLYRKSKPTNAELTCIISNLDNLINDKKEAEEKAKQEAFRQAEEEAKHQEESIKKAQAGTLDNDELKRLSNLAPDPDTHKNFFRPDWATYNLNSGKWILNTNLLAQTIADENLIKRVQENGKDTGFLFYDDTLGNWKNGSTADLGNLINSYFNYPEDPQLKLTGKYAFDLQTGSSQRNTLILLQSKINSLKPTQTIDQQPTYIIHFKDYDFDLEHWKKLPFSPDRYFVSNRNYNLEETTISIKWDTLKNGKKLIDSLAPITTDWLLKSLGDQETLQTFLECLGLSFLNSHPVNFIVFFKSSGGTGKSRLFEYLASLFGVENDTVGLDFDQIIKPASFDISELRNKSIDLTSDVKASYIPKDSIAILKALSGDDKRSLSQKNKGTANFANHANLWFNCNDMPRLAPESYDNSIARRFIIFDWLSIKGFSWEKVKDELQKERSELVTKALYYAKRALEDPLKEYDYLTTPSNLTRSPRVIKNYIELKNKHNLLERFIAERCKLKGYYRAGVTFFRQEFSQYSRDNGHTRTDISIETLETQLKEQYGIEKSNKPTSWKHRNETKTGNFVFQGIALVEDAGVQDEDHEYNEDRRQRREHSPYIPK